MNEQAINEAAERYADNYKRWSEELLPSTNKQAAISHRRWLDESILADWAASHIAAQREAEESGEKLRELLSEVAHSGIEYTADGKYHVVQIDVDTWQEIQALQPTKRPA